MVHDQVLVHWQSDTKYSLQVFINFADNSTNGSNTKGSAIDNDNDDLRRPTPVGASSDSDISEGGETASALQQFY